MAATGFRSLAASELPPSWAPVDTTAVPGHEQGSDRHRHHRDPHTHRVELHSASGLLLLCERVRTHLELNDFWPLALSAFLVPGGLLGMRRPEPLPFHPASGSSMPPVEPSGVEAHRIWDAHDHPFAVIEWSKESEPVPVKIGVLSPRPEVLCQSTQFR